MFSSRPWRAPITSRLGRRGFFGDARPPLARAQGVARNGAPTGVARTVEAAPSAAAVDDRFPELGTLLMPRLLRSRGTLQQPPPFVVPDENLPQVPGGAEGRARPIARPGGSFARRRWRPARDLDGWREVVRRRDRSGGRDAVPLKRACATGEVFTTHSTFRCVPRNSPAGAGVIHIRGRPRKRTRRPGGGGAHELSGVNRLATECVACSRAQYQ
jgi:hypothetical protein